MMFEEFAYQEFENFNGCEMPMCEPDLCQFAYEKDKSSPCLMFTRYLAAIAREKAKLEAWNAAALSAALSEPGQRT